MNAKFNVGIKALVTNGRKEILLIKAGKKEPKIFKQTEKFWDIPGGKMKENETVRKALEREVKEELNAGVRPQALFDAVKSNWKKNKGMFLLLIVYRCE